MQSNSCVSLLTAIYSLHYYATCLKGALESNGDSL
jgi:hypothetical protein